MKIYENFQANFCDHNVPLKYFLVPLYPSYPGFFFPSALITI